MAISIEDFRKSLNVGLSRDLVQKILTKYENFDFSSVNTNNGTKLREIDAYDPENVTDLEPEEVDENGQGRTLTCIGFRPLDDETAWKISKKYQLYR